MSIWFFVWFLLSSVLLFFSGWTFVILYKQKAGWRAFAKKHKLRCTLNKNLSSMEVSGTIDGFGVALFTSEHILPKQRTEQKLSAIEIELQSEMPIEGAIGSANMVPIIQGLDFKNEFTPKHKRWDTSYIVRTDVLAGIDIYLTEERLKVLTSLMAQKLASVILIFKNDTMILRLDTHDPLETVEKVEALVLRLIKAAKIFELEEGEGRRLMMKKEKAERMISIKENPEDAGLSLELEEDEDELKEEDALKKEKDVSASRSEDVQKEDKAS